MYCIAGFRCLQTTCLSVNFTPCACKTELLTITNAWFFLYKEPLLPESSQTGDRWVLFCQHEDLGEVLAYHQQFSMTFGPWNTGNAMEKMTWSVELLKLWCLEWIWMIQYLGCFLLSGPQRFIFSLLSTKNPCLERSSPVQGFSSLLASQGLYTRFGPMINGKSNPSYHLDICGCIRGHWMFIFPQMTTWYHDSSRTWGSSAGISSSRGKELDVAGSTWTSHLEIFGNGHINGWEETTTRSWQYHKLTCLKHPELHTCIWLESKPKFNWSKWIQ